LEASGMAAARLQAIGWALVQIGGEALAKVNIP
jgi:hypothetical protein